MADHRPFGFGDDWAFTKHLVEKVGVAVVPGSSFFSDPEDGRPYVRFMFSKRDETLREAGERLRKLEPAGEWVVGDDWDESRWREARYLTRNDLDRASETVPIAAVRVDRHMASVNSAALGLLKIPPGTRGFESTSAGVPTGVVKEDALGNMWDLVCPTHDRLAIGVQQVAKRALSLGITSVHDVVSDVEIRAYQIAKASGALPLRVYLMARHALFPPLA